MKGVTAAQEGNENIIGVRGSGTRILLIKIVLFDKKVCILVIWSSLWQLKINGYPFVSFKPNSWCLV